MSDRTRFALGIAVGLFGVIALFAEKELSFLWVSAFAVAASLIAPRPAQEDAATNQDRAVTIIIVVVLAVFGAALLLLLLAPSVL